MRRALLALALLAGGAAVGAQERLTGLVDPFVGVDRDGNTVPGAAVPFGFANPSPDVVPNPDFRFDTSGYESDKPIIGFSQTHVSGTGGESKYGNFRLTPEVGGIDLKGFASGKAAERAEPGYYTVRLTKPDVTAELTTARLTAVHRYTFPATPHAQILVDTGSVIFTGGGAGRRQRPIATTTRVVGPDRIEGTGNFIGGWNPSPYTLHFSLKFSRPFRAHGTWRGDQLFPGTETVSADQEGAGAWATFDTREGGRAVEVKIGLSFISQAKARANLEAETGGAGFDQIRRRAAALWEQALAKIAVEGGTAEQRGIFYTALYRAHYMSHDLSGENGWWASAEPHYEDYYALWDTFRALHPLLTLIQPERQRDMVRSMVDTYRHTGWMPDARIAGANGMVQGGSSADCLVADAYVKKLPGIDWKTAYAAMVKDAEVDSPRPLYEGRELGDYARGFLSMNYERSASRTVEYAYADFCIAEVAKGLGRTADHRKYLARSRNWANLWDAGTQSIRPREADGRWMAPYDKTRLYMLEGPRFTWWSAPFYEGSGYQYSTYVPHDAAGLIARVGGDAAFVRWLDAFFGPGGGGLRPEGLYTQGNEPDLLAPFLYIHAGRRDRTQEVLRGLVAKEYRTGRAGLPGNDDSGTMSAWYVWNAIGLYPNAGQDFYYVGSPVFTRATLALGGGRRFTIEARGASRDNLYVQSATLNGRPLARAWLRHAEIAAGGTLALVMGAKPSTWGRAARPPSTSQSAASGTP